jgi:predicted tellurium resistance membrane protein TerC
VDVVLITFVLSVIFFNDSSLFQAMEWILQPEAWIALATLTALEIVLGIDNIIFISILVGRLPEEQRSSGRILGLGLAMLTRIALLLSITWVMSLTTDLFTLLGQSISGRDLILISGGLFLLAKSTHEIHQSLEGSESEQKNAKAAGFISTLIQIAVIDIVFSLDSVITAVGLARDIPVMIIAILISIAIMMVASKSISDFVERHPTIKMLALSFLILVGVTLLAEGLGYEFPRGYIYFAMAFSVCVELLNLRMRKKQGEPLHLHKTIEGDTP